METPNHSAVTHLRTATRVDHEAVDGAFGHFAIGTRNGYRNFLVAHVPLAERLIEPNTLVENWSGRTAALMEDLQALGGEAPVDSIFTLPEGEAARWGALYVIQGSRLGGAVLSRRWSPPTCRPPISTPPGPSPRKRAPAVAEALLSHSLESQSFPSAAICMKVGSKRRRTFALSPSTLPPGNSMPIASTDLALGPNSPFEKLN